ncbi:ROK family protein [Acidiphilium sp. AL]|uniref:ROK family protein n=1 Tax=Acidiphilium iwatense TaxID=768198 RepID=A0ABS9DSV6_9PROT|nr:MULTISPECIES: ROK family protein [Acidiphilium]MCF3945818.1 ROK family protein [Acidiphilium iwatense]MCU4161119.1 ROK family protein [Acidiphilium sp. AL]
MDRSTSQATHRADAKQPGTAQLRTLCVDVGGSHVKAAIVGQDSTELTDQVRVVTPLGGAPSVLVETIAALAAPLGGFDRVSVGFPGAVRDGLILTAPNLGGAEWHGFRLVEKLSARLGRPVRLANDATVQGLGAISGRGLECTITLGTGMGFALFSNGEPAPHLELGQHIARNKRSYDHYVGEAALKVDGAGKWNKHVQKVIEALRVLVNFDMLYIGGGNTKRIGFDLPADVHLVSNETGITGGIRLWDGVPGQLDA